MKHLEEYGEDSYVGTYVLLLYKRSSIHRTYTLEMNLCYMVFICDEDLISVFFLCKELYGREDERHTNSSNLLLLSPGNQAENI